MVPRLACAVWLAARAAPAQPPAFEVASIKPSTPEAPGNNIQRDPAGGMALANVNLRTLVLMAYPIQPFQLSGGPPWLRWRRFDITAKASAGGHKDQTWLMLQTLLADRFQLAIHRETRELPIFEIVAAKGGIRIQPAQRAPGAADDSIQTFAGRIKALMVPMPDLALVLSGMSGHLVVDRTGLKGKYDFPLEFAPEGADSDLPSLYTALQTQLGLRLETAKGPVEMIVIDHAAMPSAN